MRFRLFAPFIALLLVVITRPVYACTYSIPVVGRWRSLQIGLGIPLTPSWAHDLILDAARVWNLAQLWFQRNYAPDGSVYNLIDSSQGNVSISFGVPVGFESIAVGWTQYVFEGPMTIVGAHVFLDGTVFGDAHEPNATAVDFAFRVALHELGRVLGLGSLIDSLDIVNPVGTVTHASQPPFISVIDLFALHVLASQPPQPASTIILSTDQQVGLNAWTLLGQAENYPVAIFFGGTTAISNKPCITQPIRYAACYT